MAFRRQIGSLADTWLKYYAQRRGDEYQSDLMGQRQMDLAGYNRDQELLHQILADPTGRIAQMVQQGGRQGVGGMPIEPFVPTSQGAQSEVIAGMNKPNLNDLPSDDVLLNLLRTHPGSAQPGSPEEAQAFDAMKQARDQRLAFIKGNQPPELRPRVMDTPGGATMGEQAVQPWAELNKPAAATALNPQQTGEGKGIAAKAEAQTPGLGTAQGQVESDKIKASVGAEASRAGRIAGATSAATEPYSKPDVYYDLQGKAHAYRIVGGKPVEVTLPGLEAGFSPTPPKPTFKPTPQETQSLNTANQSDLMIARLLPMMEQAHPGIDKNPEASGKWTDVLPSAAGAMAYKVGHVKTPYDENLNQVVGYLEANLPRMIAPGRLNQVQYEDLKKHVPQLGLSPGANYLRAKYIQEHISPDLRRAMEMTHNLPEGTLSQQAGAGGAPPVSGGVGQEYDYVDGKLVPRK